MARHTSSTLRFETLERRDMMAGNVTASVAGGDLVIKGDSASNGVVVTRVDATTYEVRGIMTGGSDTRINGVTGNRVLLRGVTDDIRVNMYGGHDEINFYGSSAALPLVAPDDLVVDMDAGNDKVGMDYVKAGGDVEVMMGSGVDSFIGVGVTTGDDLFVKESGSPFYAGNYDYVNLYGGSRIGGQLNVKLNRGHDTFKTDGTTAQSLWVEGGGGNDTTFVDKMTATAFIRIDPGTGSDNTTVQNSKVGDDLTVTESSGARPTTDFDSVTIGGNTVKDYVWVAGNRGREKVWIDSNVADRLYASLSDGDDWMNIKNTTIRSSWTLDGGAGSDTLNRYGNSKTYGSKNFNSYSYLYL
jgi:hypothetical protein